jgi:hypothetical protein
VASMLPSDDAGGRPEDVASDAVAELEDAKRHTSNTTQGPSGHRLQKPELVYIFGYHR